MNAWLSIIVDEGEGGVGIKSKEKRKQKVINFEKLLDLAKWGSVGLKHNRREKKGEWLANCKAGGIDSKGGISFKKEGKGTKKKAKISQNLSPLLL